MIYVDACGNAVSDEFTCLIPPFQTREMWKKLAALFQLNGCPVNRQHSGAMSANILVQDPGVIGDALGQLQEVAEAFFKKCLFEYTATMNIISI